MRNLLDKSDSAHTGEAFPRVVRTVSLLARTVHGALTISLTYFMTQRQVLIMSSTPFLAADVSFLAAEETDLYSCRGYPFDCPDGIDKVLIGCSFQQVEGVPRCTIDICCGGEKHIHGRTILRRSCTTKTRVAEKCKSEACYDHRISTFFPKPFCS